MLPTRNNVSIHGTFYFTTPPQPDNHLYHVVFSREVSYIPLQPAQKYNDIRIMKYQSPFLGTMSLYLALWGDGTGVYQVFGV